MADCNGTGSCDHSPCPHETKMRLLKALSHVRYALIAHKEGFPLKPQLLAAEEELLRLLFDEEVVDQYLMNGSAVIGREPCRAE